MLGCLTAGLDFSINLSPMTCPEAEKTVSQRTVSMILSIAFTFDQWQPEIKTPAWHLRPTVAQFPKSISNPHFRQTTSKLRLDTSWNHTSNNLFYHKNRWISFRLARQWYPKLVLSNSDLKDWQRRRMKLLTTANNASEGTLKQCSAAYIIMHSAQMYLKWHPTFTAIIQPKSISSKALSVKTFVFD